MVESTEMLYFEVILCTRTFQIRVVPKYNMAIKKPFAHLSYLYDLILKGFLQFAM